MLLFSTAEKMRPIVLITGASGGLGLETARALLQSNTAYEVIVGARSLQRGEAAVQTMLEDCKGDVKGSTVWPLQLDIEDDSSIEAAVETVRRKVGHIDVLINNAGVQLDSDLLPKSSLSEVRAMWDKTLSTNVTSQHVITWAFAPLLLASSAQMPRLIFISSGTASVHAMGTAEIFTSDSPAVKGWPKPTDNHHMWSYRSSKTAVNMAACTWARWLDADGIKVFIVAPGLLATNLGEGNERLRQLGAAEPSVGAEFVKSFADGERDDLAGRMVSREGVIEW